jgi:nicotinate dehydrogenase subunit B
MSRVEDRLRFEPDGTVTVLSGKMEYGQGLRYAYPRIVAEELGIDPSRVRVVLGETDVVPWDMGTFGSMSVEMDGRELRRAAAFARQLIAHGKPATGEIPEEVPLASPTPTCPDSPLGADALDLVTGRAEFVGDVRLPGMLYGQVSHPSVHGARLSSIDRRAASSQPGVVAVVVEGNFVGVVAEEPHQARDAMRALQPTWVEPGDERAPSREVALRADAGVDAAFAASTKRLARRYFTPHVANAPIGPSAGVADVRADEAFVYGTTQVPFGLRDAVARIAGLPPEKVHFRPRAMSGGYGRHGSSDAAIEAARLSKAVGRPVLVQWSRADELRGAPNRAQMDARLEAGLDASGRIVAWRSEVWTNPYAYDAALGGGRSGRGWDPTQRDAMMAGRNAVPAYEVGPAVVRLHVSPGKVRTGALRSLGASPNVFAIESFVDELAHEAGIDPIDFRLRHAEDARLRRVLETVREQSGWRSRGRGDGRGMGVACVLYRATYVAEVVEVSIGEAGAVHVERVWCAVDAGHVVHPDGARSQVEGAAQMAASWALLEELPVRGGEVLASSWKDYPIARCTDAPRCIEVTFTGDDFTPSSGLGEPPAVPVSPAIANAVFDACGLRVRSLPIRRARALEGSAGRTP